MTDFNYLPIFVLLRGKIVESIHYGAIAVVDVYGNLVANYGDPDVVTFLRSTAKPFQALPFLEHGGEDLYHLSLREIAIMCASHSGTDEHVSVVQGFQKKTGVVETDLLCGVHEPMHKPTAEALHESGEQFTSNRHNCSGKHTGMLAFVNQRKRSGESSADSLLYIDPLHPIQQAILQTFAEMCNLPIDHVEVGIDGCSAPNFAVPLRNTALAFARLCDPETGGVMPAERAAACRRITLAMTENPDIVGGPGRFDTRLMETGRGRIVSKGGAEGFHGIGLMPGTLGPASPAVGIALKISDGDHRKTVIDAVTLEALQQLGVLTEGEVNSLSEFGPHFNIFNWRQVVVGDAHPAFALQRVK